MLNREKNSKQPRQGKCIILWLYVCCTLSSLKIRPKLISGIFSLPGHLHRVRVNSKSPALQKINIGRSTSRALPFLCDLKTVMWKAGEKRQTICPDGTHLFQRQKVEPLFIPEPLNPLLNTKVFSTRAEPNAAANARPVRRSAGATLQGRSLACTPTHAAQSCLCWRE